MAELVRLPDPAIVVLRCLPVSLDAADAALDIKFPRTPNHFVERADVTIAAVGPDDWLMIAEDGDAAPLVDKLEAALVGHQAAIVDVSGNRVRYRLSGQNAKTALAQGCALDLDRLSPGDCAGTMLARMQIYLLQRTAEPVYDILPRRSFDAYLRAWFGDAA